MKHLKLFESFGGGGEYKEVDAQTWIPFGKITRFGDSKLNQIIELVKSRGFTDYYITNGIGGAGGAKEVINFEKRTDKLKTKVIIRSMEDEWFKVRIETSKKTQVTYDKEYYLCDQFDGLLKFIEEVL
jgi:hypothetical protein